MSADDYDPNQVMGFTLIEALVTIAVIALIFGIAIPSYTNFINQKRVRMGTEDLYNYIKIAQSTSQNKQINFYLSFRTGANWCYGLDDGADCDCTASNSCTVDGVETVINNNKYSGQDLSLSITGFSGPANAPYILFNGQRGNVSVPGTASFSLSGLSTTITTNKQGLSSICSDNVSSYTLCTSP